jgi:hypothetical protein
MQANAEKREKARRVRLKNEAAAKIEKYLGRGEKSADIVNRIVWNLFDEMGYAIKEMRKAAFNTLKQDVLKIVARHNTATADTRAIYTSGGVVDSIYTSENPQFLIEKIITFRRSGATERAKELAATNRLQTILPGEDVEQLILEFIDGTNGKEN